MGSCVVSFKTDFFYWAMPRRPQYNLLHWAVVSLLLVFVTHGDVAPAQTASQITPPSFQVEPQQLGGAIVFSGEPGLEAPPGAERLSVTLSSVTIDGELPDMAAAGQVLQRRLVGRPIAASEIFEAAQDLEEAYARAGYVLVRVVLPVQSLRDNGSLRLVVVDGYIERIEVSNLPVAIRPRVDAVVSPLASENSLTLGEIERRLLIAGATPGTALQSALSEGSVQGATILTLGAEYEPITGFVGLDNTLADDLGTWTLATGVEFNSLLGHGETFYLRISGYPGGNDETGYGGLFSEYPRTRTFVAGAAVPLGANGLTFNVEGVRSETTPEDFDGFQTSSDFERLSLRLNYPWIWRRNLVVNSSLIFDATSEAVKLVEPGKTTLSSDRLRVFRLGGDAQRLFSSGALLGGGAVLSFGLDGLGAQNETRFPDTPDAEVVADASFQKAEVILSYSQPLHEHLFLELFGRGQTSFGKALPTSEQIGIASFQELSTFDAGTLGGDSGWVIRGDLQSPWRVSNPRVPFDVMPYAFAATGQLFLEDPTILEESDVHVSSLGLGIEISSLFDPVFSNANLILQYGRAFRDDGLPDENRLSVVGSYRF